ncbi:MAG: ATPase-like protein [Moraxellaceae bacterium]|nr:ATPase-like protein [Moraxellaceae bacterium]
MTARARLWLLVLLLAGITLGLQQLARQGHFQSGRLDGVDLARHLEVFRDGSASRDFASIEQEFRTGHFVRPAPADLAFGYTRDAIWSTVALRNASTAPVLRYLEVGPPRLADVRLYFRTEEGAIRELRAGLQVAVRDRLLPLRQSVFPLEIAPGQTLRVYARIQSGNALLVDMHLWEPLRFLDANRHIDLLNGLQFGALLLFALYGFVTSVAMREKSFLYFGLTLFSYALFDIAVLQYGYQYLWPDAPDFNLRTPGIVLSITLFSLGQLVAEQLEARRRYPHWNIALRGISLLSLLCIPGMLWGTYATWVQFVNFFTLLQIVLTLSATLQAWLRGFQGASLLLAAFLLLWFTSFLRIGQVLGFLPYSTMSEYSLGWSMVLGGLLMAITQSDRVRRLNAEREEARQALDSAQVVAREQAETEVADRTRELVIARDAAEASNRAKSAFLTQLSHELRTPLHSILGYSGLMRAEAEEPESQRRLDAIQRSGRHLLILIDDLLDYARGEAGRLQLELQPLRLRHFLSSVAEETRELAQAQGIRLETRFAADLPDTVRLDGTRLRQVLINLLANACRHSRASVILLEASTAESHHSGSRRLILEVSDNGIGISEADRERIFQPFEQAGEGAGSQGMGLGLAISRQLVGLMGGTIELRPLVPGSRFRLCLEAEILDMPDFDQTLPPQPPRRHAGPARHLLVVDDKRENLDLLADMLQRLGFVVVTATSGEEALANLGRDRFDLVLTDLRMPGMDGWELLQEARHQGHQQPFILLSAVTPELPPAAPGQSAFAALLVKPVNADHLAGVLARTLGLAWLQGPPAAPPVAPLQRPSPAALQSLREAAAEGRISDIEDWVEQVLKREPEAAAFARKVREALRRLDLDGISAMTG